MPTAEEIAADFHELSGDDLAAFWNAVRNLEAVSPDPKEMARLLIEYDETKLTEFWRSMGEIQAADPSVFREFWISCVSCMSQLNKDLLLQAITALQE